LRISEKRYKAEQEVDHLKEILNKKNAYIRELEMKLKDTKAENSQLHVKVYELEEEVKDLRSGNPNHRKKPSISPTRVSH
jgi:SMC interacting uncharacterized protein involved in chromosome segregation